MPANSDSILSPTVVMPHVPQPQSIPPADLPMSGMLAMIAELSTAIGQPMGVDISSSLREATISLPTSDIMTAWCQRLGAQSTEPDANDLGVISVRVGAASTWSLRLLCTQRG